MTTRLTSNALVLVGTETVRGDGASTYDVLIAEQSTSLQISSETTEATYINPNFGGKYLIPTKKTITCNPMLLPSGINSNGESDIAPFLEASSLPKIVGHTLLYVPVIPENSTSTGAGSVLGITKGTFCDTSTPVSASSEYVVVAVNDTYLILKSKTAIIPNIGDTLFFSGTPSTKKTNALSVIFDNVFGLSSDISTIKTLSLQFFYGDLMYQTNGVQGGLNWAFEELPKLTFEGEGTYVTPVDNQTPPAITSTVCSLPVQLKNLKVNINGLILSDVACFEALEFKTNTTQVKPTLPTEKCNGSILTGIEPSLMLKFSQVDFAKLPIFSDWENANKFTICITYGDDVIGKRFLISATDCSLSAAPEQEDVNGVLHTNMNFNVTKPCGTPQFSSVIVANF